MPQAAQGEGGSLGGVGLQAARLHAGQWAAGDNASSTRLAAGIMAYEKARTLVCDMPRGNGKALCRRGGGNFAPPSQ